MPEGSARVGLLRCPFLCGRVAAAREGAPGSEASCRLPSGRVRSLSPETVARLCTGGRYFSCPGYRFWRAAQRAWPASA